MDRDIVAEFHRTYSKAMNIYSDATLDYIAGRCCMINGVLFRGHALICESFEKALKSVYFMQTQKRHSESRHNLINIKKDLNDTAFLDKYDNLLKFLTDAHKARYTESKKSFPKPHSMTYHSNKQ